MNSKNSFVNLLKATRVTRVLTVLTMILIPAAYANVFSKTLGLFLIIPVLIYSAFSIFNAYRDNDYILPFYSLAVMMVLLLIALIISFLNKIILIATGLWIILGLVYHTVARKIIFGDTIIAGITHLALPIVISSVLVGLGLELIIFLGFASYLLGMSIGPTTNLKDIMEDKKRKYKTLVNSVASPRLVASIFLGFSFPIIFIIYKGLNVSQIWLLIFSFILLFIVIAQIHKNKTRQALISMRFYMMSSMIILIWCISSNLAVLIISSVIMFIQLIIFFRRLEWNILM